MLPMNPDVAPATTSDGFEGGDREYYRVEPFVIPELGEVEADGAHGGLRAVLGRFDEPLDASAQRVAGHFGASVICVSTYNDFQAEMDRIGH
mgnify:CR=1 FL=1